MEDIRLESKNIFLAQRSIQRFIWSEEFEQAWDKAAPSARAEVLGYIRTHKMGALRNWTRVQLGENSISYWRQQGKLAGVPKWFTMSKEELIEAVRRNEEAPSSDGTVQ